MVLVAKLNGQTSFVYPIGFKMKCSWLGNSEFSIISKIWEEMVILQS